MNAQLRAELLKLRSTRTTLGLFAALLGLVVLVVLLHGIEVPVAHVSSRSTQLTLVVGWADLFAALFAALLGALSITSEVRHGTIRPTFLVTPRRGRVVAAKVGASMLLGGAFGLSAAAVAIGVGSAALATRGVQLRLTGGDSALLLAGCAAAAALWAAIGVGVGAVVWHQVPTVVGLCAWLLFVDSLLLGDASLVGDVGRFTPGALYAAAAAAARWVATSRRDVV